MSPPTRLHYFAQFRPFFQYIFAKYKLLKIREVLGGVVLRAANRNKPIAGGNRTLILMTPPYEF